MSNLSVFLKQNAIVADEVKVSVSDRFLENGKPVKWTVKPITSQRDELLRKECTKRIPVNGKRGQYTQETDYNQYLGKMAVVCTVFPNLNDKELQDSYEVMGAEDLLKTMLLPGEYAAYIERVQEICGFDVTLEDKIEEAKN